MTAQTERRRASRQPRESRHQARVAALQMLYQWEVGRRPMDEILETFWSEHAGDVVEALPDDLRRFAAALAEGVARSVADIDPIIAGAAEHWRLERMNVMDRLILRLAVFELLHRPETPAAVIINEALELGRAFSGDESVRFINGVLDAIRRRLSRP